MRQNAIAYPGRLVAPVAKQSHWHLTNTLLALFVFFAPCYPMPTQSAMGMLSPAAFAILFIVFYIQASIGACRIYWNDYLTKITICFFVLLTFDLICILLHGPKQILYLGARLITYTLIIIAGSSLYPSLANFRRLFNVYRLSIALLSVLTILQGFGYFQFLLTKVGRSRVYFDVKLPFYKAVGFDMSDGEFGLMVSSVFLFSLMRLYPGSSRKFSKLDFLMMILTGTALIFSQSRSTYLGLCLAIVVLVFVAVKNKKVLFAPALLALVISVALGVPQYIFEGFKGVGQLERNVRSRGEGIIQGLAMVNEAPFTGVGHGNAIISVENDDHIIHNHFLNQMASAGVFSVFPVLALYALFFITAFRIYRKSTHPEIKWLALWIGVSMVQAFTELNLYAGFFTEAIPFYFGLLSIIYNLDQRYRIQRNGFPLVRRLND